MPVPNIFGTATSAIPLSQLDQNFATAITLGNTAVYLGNTTTSLGNVTLTNVTISSGNVTVSNITANAVTSPAATNLLLQSAGTTAVTIDTSQNVGIGVTPNAWSGSVVLQMTGPSVWGSAGVSHLSTNTYFDGTNYKYIATNYVTDAYQLNGAHVWRSAASGTAGTNVNFAATTTLNSNGVLALQGAVTNANGVGITFPTTAISHSSSNANTLDDYEEGTFTPIITPATGSLTSYSASGFYVKVGRHVTITMYFQVVTAGTASGVANFSGLPFTTLSTSFPAGGRAGTSAWREDNATGFFYFGYLNQNSTAGTVSTSINGPIVWSANYTYVSNFVYESAS